MTEKKEEAKSARKEEAKPAAAASAKNGKKSRLMTAAAAVVVLLGGGGAWWYTHGGTEGIAEAKAKTAPVLPPVFVALESFTVNLQPETAGSQYMQVGITLKIAGQAMADKLKEQMPEVRSRLLMVLSAKKASELLVPAGKIRLAQELLVETTQILDPEAAKKPGTAPAAPVSVATAPSDTSTDASEQTPENTPPADGSAAAATAGDTAEAAPAETPADNTNTGPVLSVLFTSFIIQ